MKQLLAGILVVLALFVATSVSWGKGKGPAADSVAVGGVTWESFGGVTWE